MSGRNAYAAPRWAVSQRVGDVGTKATLLTLATYAGKDEDGRYSGFPSQATIAQETEQSPRTVTGPSEEAIAEAVDDLLTRASATHSASATPGKSAKGRGRKPTAIDRRIAARTKATAAPPSLPETPSVAATAAEEHGSDDATSETTEENEENAEPTAEVIPLRIFDAHEEAKRWW